MPRGKRDLMPTGKEYLEIDAGRELRVLFVPTRPNQRDDGVERTSIYIAVAGQDEQVLRLDPFSVGAHYHILPDLQPQFPLVMENGESPINAALNFFRNPGLLRDLLTKADEPDVAARVEDADLKRAAKEITQIYQAAHAGA